MYCLNIGAIGRWAIYSDRCPIGGDVITCEMIFLGSSRLRTFPIGHSDISRSDTVPIGHRPDRTQTRSDTVPIGHRHDRTQSRSDTDPIGHNPDRTHTVAIGHSLDRTQTRSDTVPIGHSPDYRTQTRLITVILTTLRFPTLPTGGMVAGGGPKAPLAPSACVCVCVHMWSIPWSIRTVSDRGCVRSGLCPIGNVRNRDSLIFFRQFSIKICNSY